MPRVQSVIRTLDELHGLSTEEREALLPVTDVFEFRVSRFYSSLIDWSDPSDPLRRLILPSAEELAGELDLDPSDERQNTPVPNVQHKYDQTALVLVSDICASYCRFCFRKRFTLAASDHHQIRVSDRQAGETSLSPSEALEYIAEHPEIDNVLVTGGDPLMLSPRRIRELGLEIAAIPHVRLIRFGTKVPAFDPERITTEMVKAITAPLELDVGVHLMAHFTHPRELTSLARDRTAAIRVAGAAIFNQTPLLRGVNDNPDDLVALFRELAAWAITPYYVFQCRPTRGNESYFLTLQEGLTITEQVRRRLNGLAKTFRYIISHKSGKLEVVGRTSEWLILRYHQSRRAEDQERIVLLPVDEPTCWPQDAALSAESHRDIAEPMASNPQRALA
ncbi:MAG: KamA family radical SAM protein [Tepidisphaeraceae bacterium]